MQTSRTRQVVHPRAKTRAKTSPRIQIHDDIKPFLAAALSALAVIVGYWLFIYAVLAITRACGIFS